MRFFLLEATRCLQAAADGDQQVDSSPAQVLQPEITKRCSRQKTQYRDTPPQPGEVPETLFHPGRPNGRARVTRYPHGEEDALVQTPRNRRDPWRASNAPFNFSAKRTRNGPGR